MGPISGFGPRAGSAPFGPGAGARQVGWALAVQQRPVSKRWATGHVAGDHPERRAFIQAMSSPCIVGSKDSPSHHHGLAAKKPRF
jgi:hypothetical protein